MLQWLVISLCLLFILEPVKLHEDDAWRVKEILCALEVCDYAKDLSETLRNMNILLGSLVTRSNTQLRELLSLKEDLNYLKGSVSNLNDSVSNLHGQLAEHKEKTATSVTHLNLLWNEKLSSVDEKLENMTDFLGAMAVENAERFQNLKKDIKKFIIDNLTGIRR